MHSILAIISFNSIHKYSLISHHVSGTPLAIGDTDTTKNPSLPLKKLTQCRAISQICPHWQYNDKHFEGIIVGCSEPIEEVHSAQHWGRRGVKVGNF